ncbi:MAG: hypothetical protein IT210_24090 [Armatimonadetes bacterium]|nr:hypothetical protein [Armatimonadota bacterium]
MKGFRDPAERDRRLGVALAVLILITIILELTARYQMMARVIMLIGGTLSIFFAVSQREHGLRWWEMQFTLGLAALLIGVGRFWAGEYWSTFIVGLGLGLILGPLAVFLVNLLLRAPSPEG